MQAHMDSLQGKRPKPSNSPAASPAHDKEYTVAEKMQPSKGLLKLFIMMIVCLMFLVVSLVLVSGGVWATPYGREVLQKLAVQNMGRLVAVPHAKRGAGWKLEKILHEITLAIPGFLVGFAGDRGSMYAAFEEVSRDHPIGFRDSFAVFSHKTVYSDALCINMSRECRQCVVFWYSIQ